MDESKKALFVKKMGKKRLSLVKGGMVRRKYDLGGLLGTAGGAGGTGFHVNNGTNQAQLDQTYNQNQAALGAQQGLANTLNPQAGQAVNAQNVLSNQFAQQAQGAGPNVAQTMLNQTTGQNVANQAALMAGQRGAGSNPALIARQAAMQGANTQQQSAGQAASMQAQQQIAAQQAQAQLAANQIAQTQGSQTAATQAAQGEQGILQNANTSFNNVQGQLANTEMQGQQSLLGGIMKGASAIFNEGGEVTDNPPDSKHFDFVHKMAKMAIDHNKDLRQNMADGGIAVPTVTVQGPQSPAFIPVQPAQGGFTPGANQGAQDLKEGAASALSKKGKASAAMGTTSESTDASITGLNNPMVMNGQADISAPMAGDPAAVQQVLNPTMAAQGGEIQNPYRQSVAGYFNFAQGGKVPALVSPGEVYLPPHQVNQVLRGADPLAVGHRFAGQAKVKGDSEKNDVIPADLDEGGVVINRENAMDSKKAMKFVHKSIAKKKVRGK